MVPALTVPDPPPPVPPTQVVPMAKHPDAIEMPPWNVEVAVLVALIEPTVSWGLPVAMTALPSELEPRSIFGANDVAFVPPFEIGRIPSVKVLGFVPEQVKKPPGQEFEITPVFATVSPVPMTDWPAVTLMPVPLETVPVATLARVFGPEKYGMFPTTAGDEVERPEKLITEPDTLIGNVPL